MQMFSVKLVPEYIHIFTHITLGIPKYSDLGLYPSLVYVTKISVIKDQLECNMKLTRMGRYVFKSGLE